MVSTRSFFITSDYDNVLRLLERKLTFKPTKEDHGGLTTVAHKRVTFGEEFGLKLDGIFVQHPGDSIVLFTHGNKHNITKFRDHYQLFTSLQQSFFTFDYPGYGASPGIPSEEAVYASARAAYAYVRHSLGYCPSKIIIYGCSMGGAVAIDLALHAEIACLITESTFTNSWDMGKHLYPYLPVWPLLSKRFCNDEKISSVKVPLLLIHGEADRVVPVEMASILYQSATAPAKLVLIPEANHITSLVVGGEGLRTTINNFMREHTS